MSRDKFGNTCDVCGHRPVVAKAKRRDRCARCVSFDPMAITGTVSQVPLAWQPSPVQWADFNRAVLNQYSGEQIASWAKFLADVALHSTGWSVIAEKA